MIGVSQAGKASFLKQRAAELAALLDAGVCICLPDVRGTGATREGTSRGRTSGDTNRSVNLQMFGETTLGQRLRDLRSVMRYLRRRTDVDAQRMAIWGDSFSVPNPPGTNFDIPHGVERTPRQPEPLGGLLAWFGALYEDDLAAIYIHRGLVSYASVLASPHVYIPHDACVPQALNAGDLADISAAIAPTPVRFASMVDGLNREVSAAACHEVYARASPTGSLPASITVADHDEAAAWLIEKLVPR